MFNRRLSQNPDDASAINGLGLLAVREVSYQQAEKYLSKAVELKPDNPMYLTDLGELALKMRDPEKAAQRFERARRAGDNLLATLGLARAYELGGRTKEAAPLYDKAVGMAGEDYPPALEMAGRFFGQVGQTAKGHYVLSTYYVLNGRFTDALFHCGEAQRSPGGATYKGRCDQRGRDLEEVMKAVGQKPPPEKKGGRPFRRRRAGGPPLRPY
jgi:predicted Zn-dependent protease